MRFFSKLLLSMQILSHVSNIGLPEYKAFNLIRIFKTVLEMFLNFYRLLKVISTNFELRMKEAAGPVKLERVYESKLILSHSSSLIHQGSK
ncbi:LOW QUALITY PROTEIN: hypothetical protein TorRG33x02_241210 [Trema orientale]|uniref:Uncharacterized protein n=1 Tax=Trema orientale TaxID=63057 RepID=A0A2P5DUI2_TREOI|nr:LOW QUALITY PROTEIN: hypothetical protein TorRG33x02_241210 [Trema orientale]